MEQIIYKVNNINYLLFSAVCKTKTQATRFTERIKKHNGIIQAYDVEESFWNGTKVSVKVLIPEHLAISFSNSEADA